MRRLLIVTAAALMAVTTPAWAGLTLSTDHRAISFGLMQLGEEKALAEAGSFHNEITVSSTNGQTWYLKISLLQPLTFGSETIPLEAFSWQLATTTGNGTVVTPFQARPFSLTPELVYISGPNEAGGTNVRFQLKYLLKIPEAQARGLYQTTIRVTLAEIL